MPVPPLPAPIAAPPGAKNILYIAVDDMRPSIGAYNFSLVHTPNMDKLASEALRFDRAYVQYAYCESSPRADGSPRVMLEQMAPRTGHGWCRRPFPQQLHDRASARHHQGASPRGRGQCSAATAPLCVCVCVCVCVPSRCGTLSTTFERWTLATAGSACPVSFAAHAARPTGWCDLVLCGPCFCFRVLQAERLPHAWRRVGTRPRITARMPSRCGLAHVLMAFFYPATGNCFTRTCRRWMICRWGLPATQTRTEGLSLCLLGRCGQHSWSEGYPYFPNEPPNLPYNCSEQFPATDATYCIAEVDKDAAILTDQVSPRSWLRR